MPDAIHTQIATDLQVSDTPQPQVELPADIQYMPPGRHTINATRNKQPVTVDITADQNAATTLNAWLQDRLESAAAGSEDRPFFDFNHEDREAAAWPTEFYWAGDDPITGGIRAKVEWSGAGEDAIRKRTFRRFSPTFIPDADGRVIGSETNMGGLVNRAAFKTIQPLFAKDGDKHNPAIDAHWSDEARAASLKVRRKKAEERRAYEQASADRERRAADRDRRPGESQTERDTRLAQNRTREDSSRARNRQRTPDAATSRGLRMQAPPEIHSQINQITNQYRDFLERQSQQNVREGGAPLTKAQIETAVKELNNDLVRVGSASPDGATAEINRQAEIWQNRFNTANQRLRRQVGLRSKQSAPIEANWSDEARAASLKVRRANAKRRAEERLQKQAEWKQANLDAAKSLATGLAKKGIRDSALLIDKIENWGDGPRRTPFPNHAIPKDDWSRNERDFFTFDKSNNFLQAGPNGETRIQTDGHRRMLLDRVEQMTNWAEAAEQSRRSGDTPPPPAWAEKSFKQRHHERLATPDNILNDYYRTVSPDRETELRQWLINNNRLRSQPTQGAAASPGPTSDLRFHPSPITPCSAELLHRGHNHLTTQQLNHMTPVSANWSDQARAESLRVRRELAAQRRAQAERSRENRDRNERASQAASQATTRPDLHTTSRNDMTWDDGHMLDRNNRLDEFNQVIEDAGIDALDDSELAQYLDDIRDLITHQQSINDTEEAVLEQVLAGELDIPLSENQDDPITAWLEARNGAYDTVQQLLNTDADTARQWAAEYEQDPDMAGPPPNGGDPVEFHNTLRFHFPARDNEGIIPSDSIQSAESNWSRALDEIKAKWTDAARAASKIARRAMGWPGLSQRWNRGSQPRQPKPEDEQDADRNRRAEVADDPAQQANRDPWSQQEDESIEEYEERLQQMRDESRSDDGQSGGHNMSDDDFVAAINEGGFSSDSIGNADESDIAAVVHQLSPERQDEWFSPILNDPTSMEEAVGTLRQQLSNNQPIDDYSGAFLDALTRKGYAGEGDGDPVFQEMERRAAQQADNISPDQSGMDEAFREQLRRRGIDPNRQPNESTDDYINRLLQTS